MIIENQLEATDHNHLGQLLTYAAGYDAYAVVWLAREFRDEHRAALEWLNGRTGEDTAFFGVVVEALRIDNSRPAPHFRLVTTPNDWQKQIVKQSTNSQSNDATETQYRYRAFFQKLIDTMREDYAFTNAKIASGKNVQRFSAGVDGCYYVVHFATGEVIRVYLYLGTTVHIQAIYNYLIDHKEIIEQGLDTILYWRQPNYTSGTYQGAYQIGTMRTGSIFDDQDALDEIHRWTVHHLLSFKQTFAPHIKSVLLNARRHSHYSALPTRG